MKRPVEIVPGLKGGPHLIEVQASLTSLTGFCTSRLAHCTVHSLAHWALGLVPVFLFQSLVGMRLLHTRRRLESRKVGRVRLDQQLRHRADVGDQAVNHVQ
jgi:hypothetical protein